MMDQLFQFNFLSKLSCTFKFHFYPVFRSILRTYNAVRLPRCEKRSSRTLLLEKILSSRKLTLQLNSTKRWPKIYQKRNSVLWLKRVLFQCLIALCRTWLLAWPHIGRQRRRQKLVDTHAILTQATATASSKVFSATHLHVCKSFHINKSYYYCYHLNYLFSLLCRLVIIFSGTTTHIQPSHFFNYRMVTFLISSVRL